MDKQDIKEKKRYYKTKKDPAAQLQPLIVEMLKEREGEKREVKEDISTEEIMGETPSIQVSQEVSLHDKYRKYIDMTKEGYLRGLTYEEGMEMLRWIEKVTGKGFPINYSCGVCMVDLVKRFAMLEGR